MQCLDENTLTRDGVIQLARTIVIYVTLPNEDKSDNMSHRAFAK